MSKKKNDIELHRFFSEYLVHKERLVGDASMKSIKTCINVFKEFIGNPRLSSIRYEDCSKYIDFRLSKVSRFAVKRDIVVLKMVFNYAVEFGFIKANPFGKIKKPRIAQQLPVYFTKTEEEAILKSIKFPDLAEMILFALNTGLRQGDLLNLQWRQIDLINECCVIDNQTSLTKSRRAFSVPLNKTALSILEKRKAQKYGGALVFTNKGVKILPNFLAKRFREAVKSSGINPKLKFHSTRHTFASRLVQKGVSIYHVSKLLNHSTVRTTEIYSHLRSDDLKTAVQMLE